jgi:hypothetical protein
MFRKIAVVVVVMTMMMVMTFSGGYMSYENSVWIII